MNRTRLELAGMTSAKRRELLAELLKSRLARSGLSFSQERLWFLDQLSLGAPVYNVPAVVRLRGVIDATVLERSLNEIVARHEVLRTAFKRVEGGPVPVLHDATALHVERLDLSGLPDAAREQTALERANLAARTPFDLERDILLRALLLQLGPDDHYLAITMHHIAAEGWSVSLLFAELEQIYEAFLQGDCSPLDPLPMQYSDYARWQRERMTGELLEHELAYWRHQLAGELPLLELPADRPRPQVQSFAGSWASRSLRPGLKRAATTLAQLQGATLFMVLLAAFQALLRRYTGQNDILVGSPIAGRYRLEAEQLIGVFINTLVMRTDLSGDPTFNELLSRVRQTAVGAFSHQELPFELLAEKLRPERHVGHTPIFQVMFALQNTPLPVLNLAGLEPAKTLDPSQVHNGTTKVDLSLFVEEADDTLRVGCEYSSDLFDSQTIDRFLAHYEVLLAHAVQDPERPLSLLDVLTEPERQRLLFDWNNTATTPPGKPVHELFEQQAALRPDAIAIVTDDTALTYAELDERANRLARFLVACGTRSEYRVAICLERSPELVVALVAVLKAGASYLALDPEYPASRLKFMLEDAGAYLVLTQEDLLASLPETSAHIVCVDRDSSQWDRQSAEAPGLPVDPEQLAYVIYTSGSTGRPKGVSVPHRAVVRLVRETNYARFAADEVFLQLAPIAFDASTFEVWGPLLNGACLAIYPPEQLSLDGLASFIERHKVTAAWLTAALFHQFVDRHPEALRNLNQLLAGGDVLDPARVRTALKHLNGATLVNGYGPTENTTFTCCHSMLDASDVGNNVSIGRPISNTRVYVLDSNMSPVPAGIPGELYIAGTGLARNYLGRPALTAESFVPNPFADKPGDRLYRSGDLARYLHDGRIEFLGRADYQVKVRGYRIELGEIQAILGTSPAVRDCVVVAREDMGEDKRIVAYVVATQADSNNPKIHREFLAERVPEYMIPSAFVPLGELPILPNGKVDRGALPAPSSRPNLDIAYAAPLNEVESVIAGAWREALSLDKVGRGDNFFDLGGHSLLLAKVHDRLRERLDPGLTIVDMFRYPTVASLAKHIARGN